MKKLLTVGLLVIGLTIFSNVNLYAQGAEGDIQIGGGLGYGTEIESLGIQAGGVYTINDQFRGALDLIYYFPNDSFGYDFTWFEINANGHYLFLSEDDIVVYGLAGLNIATLKFDYPENQFFGGGSVSESEVGINIGAGIEYNLGGLNLYGEAKYALSSADQLVISGGVRIPIN